MEKIKLTKIEYNDNIVSLNLHDYFEQDGELFFVQYKHEDLRPVIVPLVEEFNSKYIWQ